MINLTYPTIWHIITKYWKTLLLGIRTSANTSVPSCKVTYKWTSYNHVSSLDSAYKKNIGCKMIDLIHKNIGC